jgi:hypothetical protein
LRIEGDELSFDNHFYAAVHLPGIRTVMVLSEERPASRFSNYFRPMLEIAAEDESRLRIEFKGSDRVQIAELEQVDAIILDGVRSIPDYLAEALIEQVQAGAGLLLMPAADGSLSDYNRLLTLAGSPGYGNVVGSYGSFTTVDRMAPPEGEHPLLNGIFEAEEGETIRLNVPEFFYFFDIVRSGRAADQPVLTLRTGTPLLMETRLGEGKILYSAAGSDPGWSNFPLKPFFAPLFYNVLNWLAGSEPARLLTHETGSPFRFEYRGDSAAPLLQKGEERILPETRQLFRGREIIYAAEEWVPGWLRVDPEDQNILIGVNFDTMESDLNPLTKSDLGELFRGRFALVQEMPAGGDESLAERNLRQSAFGKEIWYWFVFIALILLLLETVLSKLYKTENI